jgi:exosome complex component RRP41
MPLDTSSYSLSLLRLDGRRWSELRTIESRLSVKPSADGSSLFTIGRTSVICLISGPHETRRTGGAASDSKVVTLDVEISMPGFSSADSRRRVGKGDRRAAEMAYTVQSSFAEVIQKGLYPSSTISITLHVLSQDGSLLAALINATTLGLIDAGIPLRNYLTACTAGVLASATISGKSAPKGPKIPGLNVSLGDEADDPLMDVSGLEEQEVPFITIGLLGEKEVVTCVLETRVELGRVEELVAVAVEGCRGIRKLLDGAVREHGRRVLNED